MERPRPSQIHLYIAAPNVLEHLAHAYYYCIRPSKINILSVIKTIGLPSINFTLNPILKFRQLQRPAKMRPDFATKQFYLLGEDVSTAREIDVPSTIDEDELRQLIASNFAIVGAKGTHATTRSNLLCGCLVLTIVARHWVCKRPRGVFVGGRSARCRGPSRHHY